MVDFAKFAVYRTIDIDLAKIIDVLGRGIFGNKKQHDLWAPVSKPFLGEEPSKLIKHHRKFASSEELNKSLFVVVDRIKWETEGLLIVNLNFKGYVDAIRQRANFAGDDVPSMNIGNTSWYENLCHGEQPLFPRKAFAVHILNSDKTEGVTRDSEDALRDLMVLLNGGLEGRKANDSTKGGVCVAEKLSLSGLKETKEYHRKASKQQGYDPEIFIVVDDSSWDSRIVLLFGLRAVESGLRVKAEMVAEILQWLYVGLIYNDSVLSGEDWIKLDGTGLLASSGEPRS